MGVINMLQNAFNKMSGDSEVIVDVGMQKEDVLKIINAVILIASDSDKKTCLNKLNEVFKLVDNDNYSSENLGDIIGVNRKQQKNDLRLSKAQLARFKNLYPIYYYNAVPDNEYKYVLDAVRLIDVKYPEPPHLYSVIYDAEGNSVYFPTYILSWNTHDSKNDSIAWAFNGYDVYLIHFIYNIFDSGLRLNSTMLRALFKLLETGEEQKAHICNLDYNIEFKCKFKNKMCYLYMSDEKIMKLDRIMVEKICMTVDTHDITYQDHINSILQFLYIKE